MNWGSGASIYYVMTMTHFVLHLPQKLLFAHIVQPQGFAYTSDEAALEGHDRKGHVIGISL